MMVFYMIILMLNTVAFAMTIGIMCVTKEQNVESFCYFMLILIAVAISMVTHMKLLLG